MNWFKDRMKDDLWVKDLPIAQNEIDMTRMRAYLDFAETEKVEDLIPPYEVVYYKNMKGNLVSARVLIRRKNGEIVIKNINGVYVCLTEKDLEDGSKII